VPSTKNTHYFQDYRQKFFAFYKGIFNSDSNNNFIETLQDPTTQFSEFSKALGTILSNLPKIGFNDVHPLDLAILQRSEDSDDAIKIMADVRAYFQGT